MYAYAGMRIVGHSYRLININTVCTHIWWVRAHLNVQYRCSDEYNVQRKRCTCVFVCDVCTVHVVDALLSQPTDTIHRMPIELCNIFVFGAVCTFLCHTTEFRCVFFDHTHFFCSKVISTYGTLHLHKVRIRKHSRLLFIVIVDFFVIRFSLPICFCYCFPLCSFQLHSPFGQSVNPKCAIVLNHRSVLIN